MSKLNINKTIGNLEDINKRLGFEYSAIKDAIKVCMMWKDIKFHSELKFDYIMEKVEEEYFPSKVERAFLVKMEGDSEEQVNETKQRVYQMDGVKAVTEYETE